MIYYLDNEILQLKTRQDTFISILDSLLMVPSNSIFLNNSHNKEIDL